MVSAEVWAKNIAETLQLSVPFRPKENFRPKGTVSAEIGSTECQLDAESDDISARNYRAPK